MSLDKIIKSINHEASRKGWRDVCEANHEYFYAVDFAGANIDDAFDGGMDQGRIDYAKELLALLNK